MKKAAAIPLAPRAYLEPLAAEMDAFEKVARDADPKLPVQFSKKWLLADLVRHLSTIHRWAAGTVRKGTQARGIPRPPAGKDLGDWYRESADELLDALRAADPAAPCWNFSRAPRLTSWWFRRQTHETIIHGRDAELAAGARREIPGRLAADGIDEVLTVLMPIGDRWGNKAKPRLTGPVLLRANDTGHRWLLTPGKRDLPEAAAVTAGKHAEPAAQLSGRAEDLMLMLWGRIPVDGPEIRHDGESEMAMTFLRNRLAL